MHNLHKLRKLYQLKNVERSNSVAQRKESSAEHSWSCLILADYVLSQMTAKMDRVKVYELLMYHDVVEIEAGDVNLLNQHQRQHKAQREQEAAHLLKEHLPPELGNKFWDLFQEFEEGKTKEARFAKAIDALDAQIHELDYKEDWKGWTEQFLREKKGPILKEFPELNNIFEQLLTYLRKEGYFQ